jgi:hypothetical protein
MVGSFITPPAWLNIGRFQGAAALQAEVVINDVANANHSR